MPTLPGAAKQRPALPDAVRPHSSSNERGRPNWASATWPVDRIPDRPIRAGCGALSPLAKHRAGSNLDFSPDYHVTCASNLPAPNPLRGQPRGRASSRENGTIRTIYADHEKNCRIAGTLLQTQLESRSVGKRVQRVASFVDSVEFAGRAASSHMLNDSRALVALRWEQIHGARAFAAPLRLAKQIWR